MDMVTASVTVYDRLVVIYGVLVMRSQTLHRYPQDSSDSSTIQAKHHHQELFVKVLTGVFILCVHFLLPRRFIMFTSVYSQGVWVGIFMDKI